MNHEYVVECSSDDSDSRRMSVTSESENIDIALFTKLLPGKSLGDSPEKHLNKSGNNPLT